MCTRFVRMKEERESFSLRMERGTQSNSEVIWEPMFSKAARCTCKQKTIPETPCPGSELS